MTSFWLFILFFVNEFFIFRLKSVVCKKYTNNKLKEQQLYQCDGDAASFIACIVSGAGSFIS